MGTVVHLVHGRTAKGRLPKPVDCMDCGEPIETKRLQVQPTTTHCIHCAQARENRHRRILDASQDTDIVIIKGQ